MFGFLQPHNYTAEYARTYTRVCQYQGRHYGAWSLAFHNYEAVFLFQCAVDAGRVDVAKLPDRQCCMMDFRGPLHLAADADVGRFCASVATLLGSVKLDDDIRDGGRPRARLLRRMLAPKIEMAHRYFCRIDPGFRAQIAGHLAAHHELEGRAGVPIEQYAAPTAGAFAYLFGLAAALPGLQACRQTLAELGRRVGTAIIAFDCAADWDRDHARGEFNPLPDRAAVGHAHELSTATLAGARDVAAGAFGPQSLAARTPDSVRARLTRATALAGTPIDWWAVAEGCAGRLTRAQTWSKLSAGGCRCITTARMEPSDCEGVWQDDPPPAAAGKPAQE